MTDELVDRLDGAIDAVVARRDATAALRDPELAPLVRIAADLRHYPSADFKTRLRAQLARRPTMSTAVSQAFAKGSRLSHLICGCRIEGSPTSSSACSMPWKRG